MSYTTNPPRPLSCTGAIELSDHQQKGESESCIHAESTVSRTRRAHRARGAVTLETVVACTGEAALCVCASRISVTVVVAVVCAFVHGRARGAVAFETVVACA